MWVQVWDGLTGGLGEWKLFSFITFLKKKILIQVFDNFTHKRKTIACF